MHGHFYLGAEHRPLGRGKVSAGGHPWPRAGRADLEAAGAALAAFPPAPALAALERAALALAGRLPAILERRLALDPLDAARAAGWVGAPPAPPVGPPRRRAAGRGEARGEARSEGGPVVLAGHWTQLGDRPLEVLREAFGRGRPVLWFGDEHLPEIPQAWVEELAAAGLDPRALALLHAPDPAVSSATSSALVGRSPGLARIGVEADVELAAAHLVTAALADVPALGGRRAGALRRVICHPRRFSALTEALVAELDDLGDLLPALDRGAGRELDAAVELALDRGGTPVRGGRGGWRPALVVHAEPQPAPGPEEPRATSVPLIELERAPLGPDAAGSSPRP